MFKRNKWFLIALVGAALLVVAVRTSSPPRVVQSQAGVMTLDGRWTYVPDSSNHLVSIIDNTTGTVVKTIPVGRGPNVISLSPDGRRVLVANTQRKSGCIIEIATNRVVGTYRLP